MRQDNYKNSRPEPSTRNGSGPRRLPFTAAEVVQVEVSAANRGTGAACARAPGPVRAPPERRRGAARPHAPFGLRMLDPAVAEGTANMNDAFSEVDITPLERDPLARPQPGGRREDHHRTRLRSQVRRDSLELCPRLERTLLRSPALRIIDAVLGRIDVDHSPFDGARQHLPERSGCLESMSGRDRHPPVGDLLRTQLADPQPAERGDGLREQPAQLLDRLWLRLVLSEILIDEFANVIDLETCCSRRSRSSVRSNASRASSSDANPPYWIRLEPRPPTRQRYAHKRSPSRLFVSN